MSIFDLDSYLWFTYVSSHLYLCSYVADRNFKADHLKQKNDQTDVWLADGAGFMTERARYENHLSAAKESVQVNQSLIIFHHDRR